MRPKTSSVFHANCAALWSAVCVASGKVFTMPLRILPLPVAAIDGIDLHARHGALVDAARVDAPAVRMRTRHVEGLGAAGRAEVVLRRAGVEGVQRQRLAALRDAEAVGGDDQVQEGGARAHGAVALVDVQLRGRVDFEAHAAAVAAAAVGDHRAGHQRSSVSWPVGYSAWSCGQLSEATRGCHATPAISVSACLYSRSMSAPTRTRWRGLAGMPVKIRSPRYFEARLKSRATRARSMRW